MDHRITGPVIGVDEAGRGPVIGPLVVAAVRAQDQDELKELGVRDSKVLSPKRREELARRIRTICTVETAIVPAHEIDRLRSSITLNEIEVNVFTQVIRKHLLDLSLDDEMTIILDAADVKAKRFGFDIERKLLIRHGSVPRIVSEHKADDNYPVVSAASIIAKVIRDKEISLLRDRYGNLGSGYPADPVTRKYLEELLKREGQIPSFVRTSWETVKKMKAASGTKKLDEYL